MPQPQTIDQPTAPWGIDTKHRLPNHNKVKQQDRWLLMKNQTTKQGPNTKPQYTMGGKANNKCIQQATELMQQLGQGTRVLQCICLAKYLPYNLLFQIIFVLSSGARVLQCIRLAKYSPYNLLFYTIFVLSKLTDFVLRAVR